MWDAEADILVLGAGHNGLTAAAYLAKAGLKTLVLEAKEQVGGGSGSEELTAPGYRHDTCASIHGGIQAGPVLQELELHRFGLHYIYPDPLYASVFPDGSSLITWRSVEQTVKEIEKFSPKDAAAYRGLMEFWERAIRDWYVRSRYSPPRKPSEIYALLEKRELGFELMRHMASSPLEVVKELFEEEHVRAHVLKASIQGGILPDQFGYGGLVFTAGTGARHTFGWGIPEGGALELPLALTRCLRAFGGDVLTRSPVKEIIVENGTAKGVATADGRRYAAKKALVAGLHVRQIFLEMVDPKWLDSGLVNAIGKVKTGLSEIVLHVALSERPRYRPGLGVDDVVHVHAPESMSDLIAAYAEYRKGNRYPRAPFQILCHTLLDGKRAPHGHHVLNVGHYAPYGLSDRPESWLTIKEDLLNHEMERVREYIPNVKEKTVVGKLVVTPPEIEAGNPMFFRGDIAGMGHVLSQEGMLRPHPSISDYRTPIHRLYLTAACTYPGGSISGAPGHNCAMTVLGDLGLNAPMR
ncbi:MAG: NAD(P)/FAD-dependent oxidoreductase [Deltaproteobacteria bacterium]|nr:NAD(P)/FAD-dependent oxidoreductase [Deltaproteobacteria bacterium]